MTVRDSFTVAECHSFGQIFEETFFDSGTRAKITCVLVYALHNAYL